jgi:hypothetical protein
MVLGWWQHDRLFNEHALVRGKDAMEEGGFDVILLKVPVKGHGKVHAICHQSYFIFDNIALFVMFLSKYPFI